MTLNELLGFAEVDDLGTRFPYLMLEIDDELLRAVGLPLDEGAGWRDSRISGLKYRIDPARPQMMQKRHVHVAAAKHTSTKSKQVSWDDEGGRHDRHSFNDKLGARGDYQDVARMALGLPPETILEWVEPARAGRIMTLLEGLAGSSDHVDAPLKMRVVSSLGGAGGERTALDDDVELGLPR
jgi:hypothetical protein